MARLLANTLAILSIALFLKAYRGKSTLPRPSPEDEALQRLAVDGRVAFAAFGLAATMGGLILLDRLGLPTGLLIWLGPLMAMATIVMVGFFLRASRISGFFSAGRAVPAPYIGLAMAGLASGLSLLFLPPLPEGLSGRSLASGMIAAFVITALISGPLLRKTGALTLAGALAHRFPHPLVRLGASLITALGGLALGIAGLDAASALLSGMTGLSTTATMTLCLVLIAFIIVPGGLRGLTWAHVLGIGLTIASLALPLIILVARGTLPPLPWFGDAAAFEVAINRLSTLHPELIGRSSLSVVFVIALGLCAFHPFLMPTQAAFRSADARLGATSGLIWLLVLFMLAASSLAVTSLALQGAAGLRLSDVPDILLRASAREELTLCGAHPATIAQLREACGALPTLRAGDVIGTPLYLLTAAGELRGFGASFTSLARSGLFVLLLALSASGIMSFATTFAHEGLDHWRKGRTLTSQRLAITRLLLILALGGTAYLLHISAFDARHLLAIMMALSACLIAPLLLLSLLARATSVEALIALGLGLFGIALPLAMQGTPQGFAELAQISSLAALLSFSVAALLCLRHPKDPASEGATFVAALLHGQGDVMQDDRGA